MDESTVGVEWNSGETLAVTLVDQDLNKNTLSNEDIVLTNSFNSTIPSLQIGSPITLSASSIFGGAEAGASGMTVGTFNKIATLTSPVTALATDGTSNYTQLSFNGTTIAEMRVLSDAASYVFANYDVTQLVGSVTLVALVDASGDELHQSAATTLEKGMVQLSSTITATGGNLVEGDTLRMNFTTPTGLVGETGDSLYADIFTFGDRVNNSIYRLYLEETGDNTATSLVKLNLSC